MFCKLCRPIPIPRFIAVVNQNPLLFNTSIGENIAYGAPEKEVSEKGDFYDVVADI